MRALQEIIDDLLADALERKRLRKREDEAVRLIKAMFGEYSCSLKSTMTDTQIDEFERNFAVGARKFLAATEPD